MKNSNTVKPYLVKRENEIFLIEKACRIVADTLTLIEKSIKPGIETLELDRIAEDYIRSKNGKPAFKGYGDKRNPYPFTLCISINEVVVHGMPSNRKLVEGDIVSIDCGVELDGYFGDSALTVGVGEISEENKKLLKITQESLEKGIEQAITGNKVYDISRAVQTHCESNGFSLTRELVGHGIGKRLHEEPAIPNFVPPLLMRNNFPNIKLLKGMALAIEPMVQSGKHHVKTAPDGWTVFTADMKTAAHFEHTVIVDDKKALILTLRN